jgi:RimJ/RimL family protein N-acetyltransferase
MLALTVVGAEDGPALVEFLVSSAFPFHVIANHTRESARRAVDSGRFRGEDSRGYWIEDDGARHGVVVLEDLRDETPMFDLRLAEESRGRGIGTAALVALASLVFGTLPQARRLEGQTREDNTAMRRTFVAAGFVQEAFYRQGWPTEDGFVGSVGYALLRDDWRSGITTPIVWDPLSSAGGPRAR